MNCLDCGKETTALRAGVCPSCESEHRGPPLISSDPAIVTSDLRASPIDALDQAAERYRS